jgi:hypothetical protein
MRAVAKTAASTTARLTALVAEASNGLCR